MGSLHESSLDANHGPGLTDEQQIIRLQEFFAQVYEQKPEQFECGQIVRHKHPSLRLDRGRRASDDLHRVPEDPINGTEIGSGRRGSEPFRSGGFVDCRPGVI